MAFNIRTKLGVVLILLFMVILSISSLYYIVASRHELHIHTIQKEFEESSLIRNLQLNLSQIVMPANDFLIPGADPDEAENFKVLSAKIEDLIEKLGELKFDKPEKRELFNHAKGDYQQIKDKTLQMFSIYNPIGNPDAGQLMEEIDRIADDALTDLEKFHLFTLHDIKEAQIAWKRTKPLLNLTLFFGVSLSILIIIGTLVFFVHNIVSPIKSLRNAALEFAQGNLDKRVDVKTNDEIGYLANAFNRMGTELKKSYISLENEITKRKRAEEEIKRVATTDTLTNVYNRAKFKEIIEREIEGAKRYNRTLLIFPQYSGHTERLGTI